MPGEGGRPRGQSLRGSHTKGMASARSQEVAADAVDLYHRPVKAALLPLLALYCASWATGAGHSAPGIDTTLEGTHLNCSADVGLCMTFHASAAGSTQQWLLRTHAVAAVALCCAVVAQKELVRRIALSGLSGQQGQQGQPGQPPPNPRPLPPDAARVRA